MLDDFGRMWKGDTKRKLRALRVLIIDEISMVRNILVIPRSPWASATPQLPLCTHSPGSSGRIPLCMPPPLLAGRCGPKFVSFAVCLPSSHSTCLTHRAHAAQVSAEMFEVLEHMARAIRGSGAPFGGLQLVLCGDYCQLPPIAKAAGAKGAFLNRGYTFQCPAWARCGLECVLLTKVWEVWRCVE